MKKKVLVIDLDGTLFKINTFHYFMVFILKYSLKKFHLVLFARILFYMLLRGLKLFSHSKMKFMILRTIKKEEGIDFMRFVIKISKYKRNISVIHDESFDLKILATAAPACYAKIISELEGYNFCVATEFPESKFNDEFDNIKQTKKRNTLNYLLVEDVDEIHTLITDHIDDLPLMKISKMNFIINPNQKLENILKEQRISFQKILM